jgi:hypothetical protein
MTIAYRLREMDQRESKEERRKRQAHELEESQKALRDSIAHTQDLLDQSDELIRRHRRECEDDDERD